MRINHNIMAINANRQLAANEGATSTSLQRLSSGLKINSAADDAAGLAISEKMRTQIRGLAKAQNNAQDSISMIQTAEGSLQEVSNILQRMRELSVQSMNGILSDTEKDALAAEMTQLRQEVDRIAETSKFNNTYLLKGTLGMSIESENCTNLYKADGASFMTGINGVDISAAEQNTYYTITATTTTVGASGTSGVSTAGGASTAGGGAAVAGGTTVTTITITYTVYKRDDKGNILEAGVRHTATGKIDYDRVSAGNTFSGVILFSNDNDESAGIKINVSYLNLNSLNGIVIKTSEGGSTKLHIGANSEDAPLHVSMPDLRAEALGIDKLKIDSTAHAQETLEKVDAALTTLNGVRGDLGAYQNRLEYTLNSLAASEENLTAAESRIRDVDMAKEMVNFTQARVISQAATAMLSQANQQSQNVLSLLQGL